jgi:hypothetical protein
MRVGDLERGTPTSSGAKPWGGSISGTPGVRNRVREDPVKAGPSRGGQYPGGAEPQESHALGPGLTRSVEWRTPKWSKALKSGALGPGFIRRSCSNVRLS